MTYEESMSWLARVGGRMRFEATSDGGSWIAYGIPGFAFERRDYAPDNSEKAKRTASINAIVQLKDLHDSRPRR